MSSLALLLVLSSRLPPVAAPAASKPSASIETAPVAILAIDSAAGRTSLGFSGSERIQVVEAGALVAGGEGACPRFKVVHVGIDVVRIECVGALGNAEAWLVRTPAGPTELWIWSEVPPDSPGSREPSGTPEDRKR